MSSITITCLKVMSQQYSVPSWPYSARCGEKGIVLAAGPSASQTQQGHEDTIGIWARKQGWLDFSISSIKTEGKRGVSWRISSISNYPRFCSLKWFIELFIPLNTRLTISFLKQIPPKSYFFPLFQTESTRSNILWIFSKLVFCNQN